MNKKTKPILTVCLRCGKEKGIKHKGFFGTWMDTCDICKVKNVPCASAPHDFGIGITDEKYERN